MKVLLIHQNFPGQYLRLAEYLRDAGGYEVLGIGDAENIKNRGIIQGITTIGYPKPEAHGQATHHYVQPLEAAVRRGQSVARTLLSLRQKGYKPDVISVHPGWGEALFIREIYPEVPVIMLCEFFFRSTAAEGDFDPEFSNSMDVNFSLSIRNAAQTLSLPYADALICPTLWQKSRYPGCFERDMQVIHEGIDCRYMVPEDTAVLGIAPVRDGAVGRVDPGGTLKFRPGDEVITFVSRNLEPYRGFHVFMRSLPELQKRRPNAHVLIAGADGVSYSRPTADGRGYREHYLDELRGQLDLSRIHFLGRIPYADLRALFQVSAVHVYLTYPFVLSWSMLEAMACGCLVIGSATPPVEEVLSNGQNGLLVDFFDREGLVRLMDRALSDREGYRTLRENARSTVLRNFSLPDCFARHEKLLQNLVANSNGARAPQKS